MQGSIERPPLKVLTPALAKSLREFNQAARTLQGMGIRLHCIDPAAHRLVVSSMDGARLVRERLAIGYQRNATAGSTRYFAQFMGVTLEWREPISSERPETYAAPTLH